MATRGTLNRDEVSQRAQQAFEPLKGLNAWDRRRIIQRLERLNRSA